MVSRYVFYVVWDGGVCYGFIGNGLAERKRLDLGCGFSSVGFDKRRSAKLALVGLITSVRYLSGELLGQLPSCGFGKVRSISIDTVCSCTCEHLMRSCFGRLGTRWSNCITESEESDPTTFTS